AHVYLTYPFVASWSLREALAAGCVVIGSDTQPVREFITDGLNGLLVSFFEPERLAERVLETLEDRRLAARLRRSARAYAERNLAMGDYLDAFGALVDELVEGPARGADVEETESGMRMRAGARRG
ncbi:MAG: glycosyltransferase, partial [Acetobacteraceae bacterium]|nr:glycosyltransferase [Acetobacteraceae bacterium]